jgi:hypothetical protein
MVVVVGNGSDESDGIFNNYISIQSTKIYDTKKPSLSSLFRENVILYSNDY